MILSWIYSKEDNYNRTNVVFNEGQRRKHRDPLAQKSEKGYF